MLDEFLSRYLSLEICRKDLTNAIEILYKSWQAENKLMTCGNGGSASEAMHITSELMKDFLLPRSLEKFRPEFVKRASEMFPEDIECLKTHLQVSLPVISLVNEISFSTAFANDQIFELSLAQQIFGLGRPGDVLLAISTSGNSKNILFAAKVARLMDIKVISLTGRSGGKLYELSDVSIRVPQDVTYVIQEFHLPIYHMLCIAVENEFFGE